MSHTIKLDDFTYRRLESVRRKRETFSQAAERLLNLHDQIVVLIPHVNGHQPPEEVQK